MFQTASCLSKLEVGSERVIYIRVMGHISDNNIVDSFQPAYKACYCTVV